MIEDIQDTAIMAAFGNDTVPKLKELHVDVIEASHDSSRNVLTVVLVLPRDADARLRDGVSGILSHFEDECRLTVLVDASYLYEGECGASRA
ncbi:hypothetical protein SAMN05660464_3693 [Geodermatophilus dictyosporus]|uniref:Uncharacterized protein n=1 Tax=Geodermatophilus dictyosporus TaxID=1523247 RepID=A0A1I5RSH3_9ACTN|nr:hypothetical protein SAMN05660464_3693 [Geodermatophilus dictyosporus]